MYLRWKDTKGKTITVQFDACSKETVDSSLSITTHPVEEGSDISDHAHEGPDHISVEGYVSNSPLPSNPSVFVDAIDGSPVYAQSSLSFSRVPLDIIGKDPFTDLGEAKPNLLDSIKGVAALASPGGLTKLIVGGLDSLLHKAPDHAMVFKANEGWEDRARRIYTILRTAQSDRARIECGIKMVTLTDMLISKLGAPRSLKDGGGCTFSLDLQRVRIVKSATVAAPLPAEARGEPEKPAGAKPPADDKGPKKLVSMGKQGTNAVAKFFGGN